MVELISKARRPKAAYPGADIFFKASLGVFALALIFYAFMLFLQWQKTGELRELKQVSLEAFGKEEKDLLKEIQDRDIQVRRVKSITTNLVKPSEAITLLEGLIHPQTRIFSSKMDFEKRKILLSLQAENLLVFWEQIRLFRKNTQVKKVDIARFKFGAEGKIFFDTTLDFTFASHLFVWDTDSL